MWTKFDLRQNLQKIPEMQLLQFDAVNQTNFFKKEEDAHLAVSINRDSISELATITDDEVRVVKNLNLIGVATFGAIDVD